MRFMTGAIILLAAGPALAQTQSPPPRPLGSIAPPIVTQQGIVLPALTPPAVDENAPPRAFLEAARQALAAGRDGEALEALERAESRALTRDVRPSLAGDPSKQPLVETIGAARRALIGGDRIGTLTLIDKALGEAG